MCGEEEKEGNGKGGRGNSVVVVMWSLRLCCLLVAKNRGWEDGVRDAVRRETLERIRMDGKSERIKREQEWNRKGLGLPP